MGTNKSARAILEYLTNHHFPFFTLVYTRYATKTCFYSQKSHQSLRVPASSATTEFLKDHGHFISSIKSLPSSLLTFCGTWCLTFFDSPLSLNWTRGSLVYLASTLRHAPASSRLCGSTSRPTSCRTPMTKSTSTVISTSSRCYTLYHSSHH